MLKKCYNSAVKMKRLKLCHVSSHIYICINVVKLSHTITFVKPLLLNKLMNSLNNNQDSEMQSQPWQQR